MIKTITVLMSLTCVLFILNGCSMFGLKQDLRELDQHTRISGRVTCTESIADPVVVVLWSLNEDDRSGYWVTRCEEPFHFMRTSGKYYLMAFVDKNEDGHYQPSEEYAGIATDGQALHVEAGIPTNLVVELLPPEQLKLPPDVVLENKAKEKFSLRESQAGAVTDIDNPDFNDAVGSTGLWTPVRFLETYGVKLYFLEEYDPGKTPVLFVHGAAGHPGSWKPAIESLDRSRYQPWIVFYPSGVRLTHLAGVYAKFIYELQVKHGFKEINIVAHSMGGLVSRSMILQLAEINPDISVPVFISFASPWNGHEGTRKGVKHAPAVVPSWYDLVPDGDFLKGQHETLLPEGTEHHLYFAFKGGSSGLPFGSENSDGVITLKSQLHDSIQSQAVDVYGFNANHVGILSDPAALTRLNAALEGAQKKAEADGI